MMYSIEYYDISLDMFLLQCLFFIGTYDLISKKCCAYFYTLFHHPVRSALSLISWNDGMMKIYKCSLLSGLLPGCCLVSWSGDFIVMFVYYSNLLLLSVLS